MITPELEIFSDEWDVGEKTWETIYIPMELLVLGTETNEEEPRNDNRNEVG